MDPDSDIELIDVVEGAPRGGPPVDAPRFVPDLRSRESEE